MLNMAKMIKTTGTMQSMVNASWVFNMRATAKQPMELTALLYTSTTCEFDKKVSYGLNVDLQRNHLD